MADQRGNVSPGTSTLATDTVFCHECRNEWKRDAHGLTCPRCSSDFTEIVEPDNDPRAASFDEPQSDIPSSGPTHPLYGHNPWGDEDSDDGNTRAHIEISSGPGGMSFARTTFHSSSPAFGGPGQQPVPPMMMAFHNIFQNIMGPEFPQPGQPGTRAASPPGQGYSFPGTPVNAGGPQPGNGPNGRPMPSIFGPFTTGQVPGVGVGGGRFTYSGGTVYPNQGTNTRPAGPDLGGMLNMMFHQLHQAHPMAQARSPGRPQDQDHDQDHMPLNPFQLLLSTILNPAGGQHGDFVYTQEALDRVISQLMEQHQSGNAPGPASDAAIASLPKKKVDESMLSDGAADCSICMDSVALGDEVTELPCHHWFHEQCVGAWLREHDTCPHCRAGITPKTGEADRARTPGQEARYNQDLSTGAPPEGPRMNPIFLTGAMGNPGGARQMPPRPGNPGSGADHGSPGGGGGGIGDRLSRWFGGGGRS